MRILTVFLLLLVPYSLLSQADHYENIVDAEEEWKYLIPSSQPSNSWTFNSFDDSEWDEGSGGFGYGDGDDNTQVIVPFSIYLRKSFDITAVDEISSLIFNMDFDDGFVAYINGVEIARENILGTPPDWNQLLSTDIEAVMYAGGYPSTYIFDNVSDLLVNGSNMLAVQVHNNQPLSSDFTALPFLHAGISSSNYNYSEVLPWFIPEADCEAFPELNYTVALSTQGSGTEVQWEIYNSGNQLVAGGYEFEDNTNYFENVCMNDGCYTFHMIDTYGDGWQGGSFQIFDFFGEEVLAGSLDDGGLEVIPFNLNSDCVFPGCTEPNAINFYEYANTDDGSCILFESTNLPIVVIDTGGEEIIDDPRIVCDMGIINNESEFNTLGDPFTDYDSKIAIEFRGSSSQGFPKKSYALETQDELGENNNVSLLGMPSENDWILHGPYSDKSLMRNVITFELGRAIGRYTPRTKYCELVINGDYRGVYLLMENIKRDDDRVDIATLLPEDIEGNEVTGGYILKIDKFTGDFNGGWSSAYESIGGEDMYIQFHKPEFEDLNEPQVTYIENHVSAFEDALAGENFADSLLGYEPFIDVKSFMDLTLINELSRNIDGYRLSTFFYKEKDSDGGKLVMGPWWDYNLSFGNADYCDGVFTDGWEVDGGDCGESNPFWFERLREDEQYESDLMCRWSSYRANQWSNENVTLLIDSLENRLAEAQVRNFTRWNTLGQYVWPNAFIGQTYEEEIQFLRDWTMGRLAWIDEQLLSTACVAGCPDPMACNYDPSVNFDDGSCGYAEVFYDCDGNCLSDQDADQICDELDNCLTLFNPNQEDTNNNGIGDACEGIGIHPIADAVPPVLIKTTDLLGRDVPLGYSGVVFLHYSDGRIVKTLRSK